MDETDDMDASYDNSAYEDESMCTAWTGESEPILNNWRGWKSISLALSISNHDKQHHKGSNKKKDSKVLSLLESAAKVVAHHIPIEIVEKCIQPLPEEIQLRLAYWSFPESEDEIRLYACLANGNSIEFEKGELLNKNQNVKNMIQIGVYISATVIDNISHNIHKFDVSVTCDRKRIILSTCTCSPNVIWCCHIIAVCLNRLQNPDEVNQRPQISESLSKLDRDQLQKFSQFLISELPQQIIPIATRLLDDLLLNKMSKINLSFGGPDPTAGPSALEKSNWLLDLESLHEGIRRVLLKLTIAHPEVASDVANLTTSHPPLTQEFNSYLRPLRAKDPEGIWNLVLIVKRLMRLNDNNAVVILNAITEEIIECKEIVSWWFSIKIKQRNCINSNNNHNNNNNNNNNNNGYTNNNMNNGNNKQSHQHYSITASMQASSIMCDEIVHLWKLIVLNPKLTKKLKDKYVELIKMWHIKTLNTVRERYREDDSITTDLNNHPGFRSALQASIIEWKNYQLTDLLNLNKKTSADKVTNDENKVCDLIDSSLKISETDDQSTSTDASKEDAVEMKNEKINDQSDSSINSKPNGDSIVNNEIDSTSRPSKSECHSTNGVDENGKCTNQVEEKKQSKSNKSADDELNHLYKYNVSNDMKLKPSLQNHKKGHKFNINYDNLIDYNDKFDPIDELFYRAEALYAHGLDKFALEIVIYLANNMLDNQPKLDFEFNNQSTTQINSNTNSNHTNTTSANSSSSNSSKDNKPNNRPPNAKKMKTRMYLNACLQASDILTKMTFLCNVLIDRRTRLDLAFKVGILGLELARPPAPLKALEVKLYNQEQDLLAIIKKIPLGIEEMNTLREKGRLIKDNKFTHRGALLPVTLSLLVYDALVASVKEPQKYPLIVNHRLPIDDYIGFECAVNILNMKFNFNERDHLFLWEGIRKQRFDLSLNLLYHYKDKENRLVRIIERIIDKEVVIHHCDQDKVSSLNNKASFVKNRYYYQNNGQTKSSANNQANPGEMELKALERKYAKCVCTLNSLNSKISSVAQTTSMTYTYNLLQQNNHKHTKHYYKASPKNAAIKTINNTSFFFAEELANAVLHKAGGLSSQNFTIDFNNQVKPHKQLQFTAFLLLLYTMGLENCLKSKWQTRTFSTFANKLYAETEKIGLQAVNCLITTWKGHLIPREAASIADKCYRHKDSAIVKAGAKLALSCLSESQALQIEEIQQAIKQCKEINEDMYIQALCSIKNSYKNGGLSSEILFEVAREWAKLSIIYSEKEVKEFKKLNNNKHKMNTHLNRQQQSFAGANLGNVSGNLLIDYNCRINNMNPQLLLSQSPNGMPVPFQACAVLPYAAGYSGPPPPFPPSVYPPPPPPPPHHQTPANLLPPNFNNLTIPLNNNYNPYMITPPPPPPAIFKNYQASLNHQVTKQQQQQNYLLNQHFVNQSNMFNNFNSNNFNSNSNRNKQNQQQQQPPPPPPPFIPVIPAHPSMINQHLPFNAYQSTIHQNGQLKSETYLINAYSLGIMALDSMPKNNSDDREQEQKAIYDHAPLHYEDIMWLSKISFQLTQIHHQEFLSHIIKNVTQPIILHDLVLNIEKQFQSPTTLNNTSKSLFKQLINLAQQAFEQCMVYKLSYLTTLDFEDFARIIIKAKEMFIRSPNGQETFKRKLEVMREKHKDKEELLKKSYKLIMEKFPDFVINEPSAANSTTDNTKSVNTNSTTTNGTNTTSNRINTVANTVTNGMITTTNVATR